MAAGGCGRGPLSAPFGSGRGAQGVGKGFLEWLCPELNPRGVKKGVRAIPEKRGLRGTTDCSLVIDGMVAGTARGLLREAVRAMALRETSLARTLPLPIARDQHTRARSLLQRRQERHPPRAPARGAFHAVTSVTLLPRW